MTDYKTAKELFFYAHQLYKAGNYAKSCSKAHKAMKIYLKQPRSNCRDKKVRQLERIYFLSLNELKKA